MYFQLCSASLQHGKAQGQMAAAGARAQKRAEGISLCTILEEQNQLLCPTGATVLPICVTGTWPLSPKGAFRIITGHFCCG